MQTKWTTLSVITLFLFLGIVPVVSSLGSGPSFWMWMPESVTPAGDQIAFLFNVVMVITGVLFVDIHAIMLYFMYRYRRRAEPVEPDETPSSPFVESLAVVLPTLALIVSGYYLFQFALDSSFLIGATVFFFVHAFALHLVLSDREFFGEETSHTHGHLGIELTWTVIPTIIMIGLGIYTFEVYSRVITPYDDAVTVEVTGKQFQWTAEYPQTQVDGPDLSNRVLLPSDRPLQLVFDSPDVLHSFFVPEFHLKQDVVPGRQTIMNVKEVERTGTFDIKCAELCGVGHYRMLSTLIVAPPALYERVVNLSPRLFKLWRSLNREKIDRVWLRLSEEEFDRWIRRLQELTSPQKEQQLDIWRGLSPELLRRWTKMPPDQYEQWKTLAGEEESQEFLKKVTIHE